MHWILTTPRDARGRELLDLLVRTGTPHDVVIGGGTFGSIVPDVSPEGPVICFGSHALRHVADARGWSPGVVDVGWLDHARCVKVWGAAMLNADALLGTLGEVPALAAEVGRPEVFVRPARDDKAFEATRLAVGDVEDWVEGLVASGVAVGTGAIACRAKAVLAEWRTWVVEGRVVTSSLYRRGGRAIFDGDDAPSEMTGFALERAAEMTGALGDGAPAAYVLDVCLSEEGMRIVEVNGMAGARLYGCDVSRLFGALDGLACHGPTGPGGGPSP